MFIAACWDSDSYSLLSERSARLFYPCGCCLNPAGWFSDHSSRLSNYCAGSQVAVTKTYPAGFQIIEAYYQIVINPSWTLPHKGRNANLAGFGSFCCPLALWLKKTLITQIKDIPAEGSVDQAKDSPYSNFQSNPNGSLASVIGS